MGCGASAPQGTAPPEQATVATKQLASASPAPATPAVHVNPEPAQTPMPTERAPDGGGGSKAGCAPSAGADAEDDAIERMLTTVARAEQQPALRSEVGDAGATGAGRLVGKRAAPVAAGAAGTNRALLAMAAALRASDDDAEGDGDGIAFATAPRASDAGGERGGRGAGDGVGFADQRTGVGAGGARFAVVASPPASAHGGEDAAAEFEFGPPAIALRPASHAGRTRPAPGRGAACVAHENAMGSDRTEHERAKALGARGGGAEVGGGGGDGDGGERQRPMAGGVDGAHADGGAADVGGGRGGGGDGRSGGGAYGGAEGGRTLDGRNGGESGANSCESKHGGGNCSGEADHRDEASSAHGLPRRAAEAAIGDAAARSPRRTFYNEGEQVTFYGEGEQVTFDNEGEQVTFYGEGEKVTYVDPTGAAGMGAARLLGSGDVGGNGGNGGRSAQPALPALPALPAQPALPALPAADGDARARADGGSMAAARSLAPPRAEPAATAENAENAENAETADEPDLVLETAADGLAAHALGATGDASAWRDSSAAYGTDGGDDDDPWGGEGDDDDDGDALGFRRTAALSARADDAWRAPATATVTVGGDADMW